MKVSEIMSRPVASCATDADLMTAARMMWEKDCGVLPITDRENRVVGVITDRDVCMAVARQNRPAAEVATHDVMSSPVFTCFEADDIQASLATMAVHQVRRLPVLDAHGRLRGLLSLDDVVLRAEEPTATMAPAVSCADVVKTFRAICASRPLARHEAVAAP